MTTDSLLINLSKCHKKIIRTGCIITIKAIYIDSDL